jgi:hypothetical protein
VVDLGSNALLSPTLFVKAMDMRIWLLDFNGGNTQLVIVLKVLFAFVLGGLLF